MQFEIIDRCIGIGCEKAHRPLLRLVCLSMLAGVFIALGGVLSLYLGSGFPGIAADNCGLSKFMSGLAFPIGLFLVVTFGADLFTGNNALLIPAMCRGKYNFGVVLRNWLFVWLGNFAGALLFTYLLVYMAGLVDSEPYNAAICKIATTKVNLSPMVIFLRGIGANWLVCLAVWLALAGKNLVEKALGCWIPVFAFVALGFEHCIANMFFIPCGMMAGANVGIAQLFYNLLYSTLGNIAGGAIFVGALFGWLYGKK